MKGYNMDLSDMMENINKYLYDNPSKKNMSSFYRIIENEETNEISLNIVNSHVDPYILLQSQPVREMVKTVDVFCFVTWGKAVRVENVGNANDENLTAISPALHPKAVNVEVRIIMNSNLQIQSCVVIENKEMVFDTDAKGTLYEALCNLYTEQTIIKSVDKENEMLSQNDDDLL